MDNYSVSEIVKIICTLSGLKKKSWAAPLNGAGLCLPVLPFRQAGVPSLPRASSGPATHPDSYRGHRTSGFLFYPEDRSLNSRPEP